MSGAQQGVALKNLLVRKKEKKKNELQNFQTYFEKKENLNNQIQCGDY